MPIRILMVNRLIKFIGVFVKAFGYAFHFVCPKLRFTIPTYSRAWIKSKNETKIPKIIWQTNYTNKVSLPIYLNYLLNRIMSPDFEYYCMDHDERDKFLKENASMSIFEAYNKLTDGAAQADTWRLFVLDFVGGVYMDIDAHSVWPLSKILQDKKEIFLMTKHGYSNYFIASSPSNKYLKNALERIIDNIKNKRMEGGVYKLTGPKVLQAAIGKDKVNSRHNKITCIQGSFTNEYFQYIDKPRGKWIHADRTKLIK